MILGEEQPRINRFLLASVIDMKTLLLLPVALGTLIGTLLPVKADEDRRDRDWNDEYWHDHHDGYWHGHKGHWEYHHHKHTFIKVGPMTIEQH